MQWISVSTTSDNEVYHLYKENKKILTLIINPFTNSARVECEKQKRVFLIRKEGFMRNKTVLCNEYGIRIGELGHDNKEPFIDLNNERFYYSINNTPQAELVLYKESVENPFVTCGLCAADENSAVWFTRDKSMAETSHPGLLMALCWYMFLPVTKESTPKVAAL